MSSCWRPLELAQAQFPSGLRPAASWEMCLSPLSETLAKPQGCCTVAGTKAATLALSKQQGVDCILYAPIGGQPHLPLTLERWRGQLLRYWESRTGAFGAGALEMTSALVAQQSPPM